MAETEIPPRILPERKVRVDEVLAGKTALVVGIANQDSIAYGCAQGFRDLGAEVAITYQGDKAKPHVEPLARQLEAGLFLPLDARDDDQMDAVFAAIERRFGKLDIVLHSIAFAPRADLHGRMVDCSRDGFLQAMDISCHSFVRMAKRAEPLMTEGGTLFTMSYYGAEKVVEHYNVMGPVKAALEATARYMAAELGPKGIRVHAISPGPLKTRPPPVSRTSTSCWTPLQRGPRRAAWSASTTSGSPAPSSPATPCG